MRGGVPRPLVLSCIWSQIAVVLEILAINGGCASYTIHIYH